ncbi:hypothetical protein ML462_07395 [Gramella lutea]|uniref:Uncharacterized protein n=1 Tax=Christiangramia lutea TaxID=1607951 RepID=A0A9X1V3H4_9FLAO|nr:hypothetical protein [Christiangramia lutea]MCH4822996.1 hypothetical protein [Christiangramia lutea]
MKELNEYSGPTTTKKDREMIPKEIQSKIWVDYYFMAKRFEKDVDIISLNVWVVVKDIEGKYYGKRLRHSGHYATWKEVINNDISNFLLSLQLDFGKVQYIFQNLEIKKEGHIIKYDYRQGGCYLGIDGTDKLHIREDKFHLYDFEKFM